MKIQKTLLSCTLAVVLAAVCFFTLPTEVKAETDGYFTYTVANGYATITECDNSISGNIEIPATLGGCPVNRIGSQAFMYCIDLYSVVIPEGVTDINSDAFYGCTNLTIVTLPVSLKNINGDAFYNCSSLAKVVYNGTEYQKRIILRISGGNNDLKNAEWQCNQTPCNPHTFSSWIQEAVRGHFRWCHRCGEYEKADCVWDSGTVIKEATCQEGGQIKYTCTVCITSSEIKDTDKTSHNYGNWTKVSDTQHKGVCATCSAETTVAHTWNDGTVTKKATCTDEGVKTYTCTGCSATKTQTIDKQSHTYDHACDADCNSCGKTRSTSHRYKTVWSKNQTNHWYECSACKDKKDVAAHTPGAAATETTAQTCTVCEYVIQPIIGHEHSYAQTWTSDENDHWHKCVGCDETQDKAAHQPGDEATETTAQICTICQYVIVPALNQPETTPAESTAPSEPADSATSGGNTGVIVGVVAAAAVVIGGAVTTFVIIKKKKG